MTIGVPLDSYDETLIKVSAQFDKKPSQSFDAVGRMGPAVRDYILHCFDKDFELDRISSHLPFEAFRNLTVDEAAKVRLSSASGFDRSIDEKFEINPTHKLLCKIRNSMWVWEGHQARWNEIVDAYHAIRSFDFDVDGFTITLDHTTGYNERGASQHSRTYLDGVFAYLVHFKGEHVMTIGFSIIGERRLLLQQVQLKNRTGNRWLFRIPGNRLEHVIDRMHAAFTGYHIHIVDGADVAEKSISCYRNERKQVQELKKRTLDALKRDNSDTVRRNDDIARYTATSRRLRRNMMHLKADKPRLAAFYRNTGRYVQGESFHMRELTHYALTA